MVGKFTYLTASRLLQVQLCEWSSGCLAPETCSCLSQCLASWVQLCWQQPLQDLGLNTLHCLNLQALGVTAESDGASPMREESRPPNLRGAHLALAWQAILGICLGGLLVVLASWRLWRRHRRRVKGLRGFHTFQEGGSASSDPEAALEPAGTGANRPSGALTARAARRQEGTAPLEGSLGQRSER